MTPQEEITALRAAYKLSFAAAITLGLLALAFAAIAHVYADLHSALIDQSLKHKTELLLRK
jgi:hypothetical protein